VRDAAGLDSLARAIFLPAVHIEPAFEAPIARGNKNRLDYRLSNRGKSRIGAQGAQEWTPTYHAAAPAVACTARRDRQDPRGL